MLGYPLETMEQQDLESLLWLRDAKPDHNRLRVFSGWLVAAAVLLGAFLTTRHRLPSFEFDDAYMFHRYAMNVRGGSGIAWNPGGPHSYGLTSPLWLLPVLAATFAGGAAGPTMVWLSALFSIVALGALTFVCRRNARTPWVRTWPLLFGVLGFVLFLSPSFRANVNNGMETMLGVAMICCEIAAARRFAKGPNTVGTAAVLAAVGLLCVMTRPESGIVVIMLPVLMLLWESPRRENRAKILTYLGIFGLLVGLYLLCNRIYFGTAVPLPLYVKASHGYRGYVFFPNSMEYFLDFLEAVLPAILVLVAFGDWREPKRIAVYLLPLLAVVVYLFSFNQIMGLDGRYFMPYLPLLVVPAIDALDRWWSGQGVVRPVALLLIAILLASASLSGRASRSLIAGFGRHQRAGKVFYADPAKSIAASVPLRRLGWMEANRAFAAYAARLPGAPGLALTEAGIVGSSAPHDRILDMTGLNDRQIALHGPTADYILREKPDVIWLPEASYTWLRGQLLSAPSLLRDYDVYDGAFNYDVAIRREAPMAKEYREQLAAVWEGFYPGTKPDDYLVRGVVWDSTPRPVLLPPEMAR